MKAILKIIAVVLVLGYTWAHNVIGASVSIAVLILMDNLDIQIHRNDNDYDA